MTWERVESIFTTYDVITWNSYEYIGFKSDFKSKAEVRYNVV
ncbi:hypothetical protein [Sulfolobus acidocaldarius]|nr:hypothetical protein [Sulfolobus acidocaldarius]